MGSLGGGIESLSRRKPPGNKEVWIRRDSSAVQCPIRITRQSSLLTCLIFLILLRMFLSTRIPRLSDGSDKSKMVQYERLYRVVMAILPGLMICLDQGNVSRHNFRCKFLFFSFNLESFITILPFTQINHSNSNQNFYKSYFVQYFSKEFLITFFVFHLFIRKLVALPTIDVGGG